MTIIEAVELFLDAKLADGVAETTEAWYRGRLERLAVYLGERELADVSTQDLRLFIVSLRRPQTLYADHPYRQATEGELSPATRQGYVRVIRQFFTWLVAEGSLRDNPTRHIKLPRLPKHQPRASSATTLGALLRATEGDEPGQKRDRALLLFLADTGCRVGGAVGLTLEDLDLAGGVAMVTEKGDKTRAVMFTPATAEALRAYLQARPVISRWVFPSLKTGERLHRTSINHILYRLRARAGGVVGRCNPHSFRHAFAREYILNGGDLATLADILGHADVSVTKQFYSTFEFAELQDKHRRYSPVAQLDLAGHGKPHDAQAPRPDAPADARDAKGRYPPGG